MYPWHKSNDIALKPHHVAWLDAHQDRTEAWLRAMTRAGFDVHHIDGNHDNNAPGNLVLIEHADHMMLHGVGSGERRTLGRIPHKGGGGRPKSTAIVQKIPIHHIPPYDGKRVTCLPDGALIWILRGETAATAISKCLRHGWFLRNRSVPAGWEHYQTAQSGLRRG